MWLSAKAQWAGRVAAKSGCGDISGSGGIWYFCCVVIGHYIAYGGLRVWKRIGARWGK